MPQDDELQKILNQHFPDADHDDDHSEDAPRGGFKWIASLFALLFAAGAMGLMIYGYNYWQKQRVASDSDMPVISGPEEAVKVKPTNPGGMEIPHQDATIYDELNNKQSTGDEKTMPAAEEPSDENTVISDSEDAPPLISDAEAAKTVQNTIVETVTATPPAGTPATSAVATTALTAGKSTTTAAVPPAATASVAASEVKKVVQPAAPKTVVKEKPAAEAATAPVAKKTPTPSSATFNVQLAAVRDDAGLADKEWANIKGRAGSLLSGLAMVSPHVQVGDHTMVRLQAGPLTHDAATALCAKLKAKNQACMPVHR